MKNLNLFVIIFLLLCNTSYAKDDYQYNESYYKDLYSYALENYKNKEYYASFYKLNKIVSNYPAAYFLFAEHLFYGYGVKKNKKRSIVYYNKAAELYSSVAILKLIELKESDSKDKKWDERYAMLGDDINFTLQYGLDLKDKEKGNRFIEIAASLGNKKAQIELAYRYMNSIGTTQNYEESFMWSKEAALNGDVESQVLIGNAYASGVPVHKNFKKAIYWYDKVACSQSTFKLRVDQIYNIVYILHSRKQYIESYAWVLFSLKVFNEFNINSGKEWEKFYKLSAVIIKKLNKNSVLKSQSIAQTLCL